MNFKRINVEQTRALQQQGAVLVDIRDPESFQVAHVSGSQHLDNHSLADFIARANLDLPTVVICYHGHSSQSAAEYLFHQGFEEVYSMDGGFEEWRVLQPDSVVSGS